MKYTKPINLSVVNRGYLLSSYQMIIYDFTNGKYRWMTADEYNEELRTGWKRKRGVVSPMARVRDRLKKYKNK